MDNSNHQYHGVAIGLHWLTAILIISLLAIGTYMVSLTESDPIRFALTQWHKSFGVTVLILVAIRLIWRLGHKPPLPPKSLKNWEIRASEMAHTLLYLLMLLIPMSGWIMVSASPLEIPTMIFNSIHWPHLAPFDQLNNKADISSLARDIHAIAGMALIALLAVHIGAALRHRLVMQDDVMHRMSPINRQRKWIPGTIPVVGLTLATIIGLIGYGYGGGKTMAVASGSSEVHFAFSVMDQDATGLFAESTVELMLAPENPTASSLRAIVNTTTVSVGDSQIDATLRGEDWFDVSNYPQATFESTQLEKIDDNRFTVTGTLSIKEITREIQFTLSLETRNDTNIAIGGFSINRLDFDLGTSSQPDEESVKYRVEINYEFEVNQ